MRVINILNKEITEILIKNELLDPLIKKEILNEELSKISLTETEKKDIKTMIYEKENIKDDLQFNNWLKKNNTNADDFFMEISKPIRLNKYCLNEFSSQTEARFLAKKDMLGIVNYSLIRVKDFFQAQELYLRLKEEPLSFGSLAKEYSLGPEKDTQGLVGPASFKQGHPILLRELRTARIDEIIQPLKIEDYWVILRVQSRMEAKLDDKMQLIMAKELFDEYLSKKTNEKILSLKTKHNLN